MDAFVVGLLHYAMRFGHDIKSEAPMSERLYVQLTDQFLPAYYKINKSKGDKLHEVRIICPVSAEVEPLGQGVGAGVSCGVDSMHVFARHNDITTGCIWNLHGVTGGEDDEKRRRGWDNLCKQAREFTSYIHCDLIIGDTNWDRGVFPEMRFDGSTTYGNLFCILCLQKYWKRYYIASGYDICDFSLTLGVAEDPAHYEWILLSFASMSHLELRLDGVAQSRIEKVGDLVKYEPSRHYLNVCWDITEGGRNCSFKCPKCMRTMLNLDAWNGLDDYGEVFDIGYYHEHFDRYLAELYRGYIQHNPFSLEMREYFRLFVHDCGCSFAA